MLRLLSSCLLLILCFDAAAKLQKYNSLYTYYSKPPFIVDVQKKAGLFYDFARYLSEKNPGAVFNVIYIPRKRLEQQLKNGQLDGPILGVNPLWFNDKHETKYLWTAPIYNDIDDFVSLKTSPFEFKDITSLYNKSFAGVSGLYYVDLNELVARDKLDRVDTIGDQQVLTIVEKGWVDLGVISRSTYNYLLKHKKIDNNFHLSTIPHESFERRVLIPQDQKVWHEFLQPILLRLPHDPKWQKILSQY
ncbi:transporter substrate-binding domain-containing protein [Psychrosphaera sp. 1_MG-2023]|uniref:transporter substrate-binding domain-containing protein n=1 Tax=Psychrosphaera sp. 1_MG-2023 TaxID=3062643 RepID=UPI0026E426E3|nr:transporter substrate-binding domain-containing protein [Psychrosphaera sp. 1_MG-2023]MDO6720630.1 transporter substrate-binding domain-containing protein [Psychrosphaera sp. 1_MG-2023]